MTIQDDFHCQLTVVRQRLDALLGGVTGDWSVILAMNELAKAIELVGVLMASNYDINKPSPGLFQLEAMARRMLEARGRVLTNDPDDWQEQTEVREVGEGMAQLRDCLQWRRLIQLLQQNGRSEATPEEIISAMSKPIEKGDRR